MIEESNQLVKRVNGWFDCNNLKVNSGKTNVIIFKTKLSVNVGEANVNLVTETRFLGIQVDNNLDWTPHLSLIEGKLSKVIYTIRVLKNTSLWMS